MIINRIYYTSTELSVNYVYLCNLMLSIMAASYLCQMYNGMFLLTFGITEAFKCLLT